MIEVPDGELQKAVAEKALAKVHRRCAQLRTLYLGLHRILAVLWPPPDGTKHVWVPSRRVSIVLWPPPEGTLLSLRGEMIFSLLLVIWVVGRQHLLPRCPSLLTLHYPGGTASSSQIFP